MLKFSAYFPFSLKQENATSFAMIDATEFLTIIILLIS